MVLRCHGGVNDGTGTNDPADCPAPVKYVERDPGGTTQKYLLPVSSTQSATTIVVSDAAEGHKIRGMEVYVTYADCDDPETCATPRSHTEDEFALTGTGSSTASTKGVTVTITKSTGTDASRVVFGASNDVDAAGSYATYTTLLKNLEFFNTSSNAPDKGRIIWIRVQDDGTSRTSPDPAVSDFKWSDFAKSTFGYVRKNTAPAVTSASGSVSFTEDNSDPGGVQNGETAVYPNLVLSDSDSAYMTKATVTIDSGLQTGEDKLDCSTAKPASVTCTYTAGTGVLEITAATPCTGAIDSTCIPRADMETALRSVVYRNQQTGLDTPTAGNRTTSLTVQDYDPDTVQTLAVATPAGASSITGGTGTAANPLTTSSAGTAVTISVTGQNDPPTPTFPKLDVAFVGRDADVIPVQDASSFQVSDPDNETLAEAYIEIDAATCDVTANAAQQSETVTFSGTYKVGDKITVVITEPGGTIQPTDIVEYPVEANDLTKDGVGGGGAATSAEALTNIAAKVKTQLESKANIAAFATVTASSATLVIQARTAGKEFVVAISASDATSTPTVSLANVVANDRGLGTQQVDDITVGGKWEEGDRMVVEINTVQVAYTVLGSDVAGTDAATQGNIATKMVAALGSQTAITAAVDSSVIVKLTASTGGTPFQARSWVVRRQQVSTATTAWVGYHDQLYVDNAKVFGFSHCVDAGTVKIPAAGQTCTGLGYTETTDWAKVVRPIFNKAQCKITFTGQSSIDNYKAILLATRLFIWNSQANPDAGDSSNTFVAASGAGKYLRKLNFVLNDGTVATNPADSQRYFWASSFVPAPTVVSVTPSSVPTTGGEITITGTNFGPKGPYTESNGTPCDPYTGATKNVTCVFPNILGDLVRGCNAEPCAGVVGHLVSEVRIGNNQCTNVKVIQDERFDSDSNGPDMVSKLKCQAPSGNSQGIDISVNIQHQSGSTSMLKSGSQPGLFNYGSPTVESVKANANTCGPTSATCPSNTITVLGTNFGLPGTATLSTGVGFVKIRMSFDNSEVFCTNAAVIKTLAYDPTCTDCPADTLIGGVQKEAITCEPPESTGINHDVQVKVSGQESAYATSVFSYNVPTITETEGSPATVSFLPVTGVEAGKMLTVTGNNFGPPCCAVGSAGCSTSTSPKQCDTNIQKIQLIKNDATSSAAETGGAAATMDCSDQFTVVSHTQIVCKPKKMQDASAGGFNLSTTADLDRLHTIAITVRGQTNADAAYNKRMKYLGPTLTSIYRYCDPGNETCPANPALATAGYKLNFNGDDFKILGSNFGDADTPTVVVQFKSTAGVWYDMPGGAGYAVPAGAQTVKVTTSHTEILGYAVKYNTATSGGTTQKPDVKITVDGIESNVLALSGGSELLYEGPALDATMIYGDQFGYGINGLYTSSNPNYGDGSDPSATPGLTAIQDDGSWITIKGRNFAPKFGFSPRTLNADPTQDKVEFLGGDTVSWNAVSFKDVTKDSWLLDSTTLYIRHSDAISAAGLATAHDVDNTANITPRSGTTKVRVTLEGIQTDIPTAANFTYLGPLITGEPAAGADQGYITTAEAVYTEGSLATGAKITIKGKRFGPVGTAFFNTGTYANAKVRLCLVNSDCSKYVVCDAPAVTTNDGESAATCNLDPNHADSLPRYCPFGTGLASDGCFATDSLAAATGGRVQMVVGVLEDNVLATGDNTASSKFAAEAAGSSGAGKFRVSAPTITSVTTPGGNPLYTDGRKTSTNRITVIGQGWGGGSDVTIDAGNSSSFFLRAVRINGKDCQDVQITTGDLQDDTNARLTCYPAADVGNGAGANRLVRVYVGAPGSAEETWLVSTDNVTVGFRSPVVTDVFGSDKRDYNLSVGNAEILKFRDRNINGTGARGVDPDLTSSTADNADDTWTGGKGTVPSNFSVGQNFNTVTIQGVNFGRTGSLVKVMLDMDGNTATAGQSATPSTVGSGGVIECETPADAGACGDADCGVQALAEAQVDTVTVSGTWAAGDVAKVTINDTEVTYTDAGDGAVGVATKLAEAINADAAVSPLLTAANPSDGVVTLTAKAGQSFVVTNPTATDGGGDNSQDVLHAATSPSYDYIRCKLGVENTNVVGRGIPLKVIFCEADSSDAHACNEASDAGAGGITGILGDGYWLTAVRPIGDPTIGPTKSDSADSYEVYNETLSFTAPTITSIDIPVSSSTTNGWVGTSVLTIRGTNFGGLQAGNISNVDVAIQQLHTTEQPDCAPALCSDAATGNTGHTCILCTYTCAHTTGGNDSQPCIPYLPRKVVVRVGNQLSVEKTLVGGVPGPVIETISNVYIFGGASYPVTITGRRFGGVGDNAVTTAIDSKVTLDSVRVCDRVQFWDTTGSDNADIICGADNASGTGSSGNWTNVASQTGANGALNDGAGGNLGRSPAEAGTTAEPRKVFATLESHTQTAGDATDALTMAVRFSYSVDACTGGNGYTLDEATLLGLSNGGFNTLTCTGSGSSATRYVSTVESMCGIPCQQANGSAGNGTPGATGGQAQLEYTAPAFYVTPNTDHGNADFAAVSTGGSIIYMPTTSTTDSDTLTLKGEGFGSIVGDTKIHSVKWYDEVTDSSSATLYDPTNAAFGVTITDINTMTLMVPDGIGNFSLVFQFNCNTESERTRPKPNNATTGTVTVANTTSANLVDTQQVSDLTFSAATDGWALLYTINVTVTEDGVSKTTSHTILLADLTDSVVDFAKLMTNVAATINADTVNVGSLVVATADGANRKVSLESKSAGFKPFTAEVDIERDAITKDSYADLTCRGQTSPLMVGRTKPAITNTPAGVSANGGQVTLTGTNISTPNLATGGAGSGSTVKVALYRSATLYKEALSTDTISYAAGIFTVVATLPSGSGVGYDVRITIRQCADLLAGNSVTKTTRTPASSGTAQVDDLVLSDATTWLENYKIIVKVQEGSSAWEIAHTVANPDDWDTVGGEVDFTKLMVNLAATVNGDTSGVATLVEATGDAATRTLTLTSKRTDGTAFTTTVTVEPPTCSEPVVGTTAALINFNQPKITSIHYQTVGTKVPTLPTRVSQLSAAGNSLGNGTWITITGEDFGPNLERNEADAQGLGVKFLYDVGTEVECKNPIIRDSAVNGGVQSSNIICSISCLIGEAGCSGRIAGSGVSYSPKFFLNSAQWVVNNNGQTLDYAPPTVTSVSAFDIWGNDKITIAGTNFGGGTTDQALGYIYMPTNAPAVRAESVRIKNSNLGLDEVCTNPMPTNHNQITCQAPLLKGKLGINDADVDVTFELTIGPSATTNGVSHTQQVTQAHTVTRPTISSITSPSIFGSKITITGKYFGPAYDGVTNNITLVRIANQDIADISAYGPPKVTVGTTGEDEGEIELTIPPAPGGAAVVYTNEILELVIGGVKSILLDPTSTASPDPQKLNSKGPTIKSATEVSTAGGLVTIKGYGFPPVTGTVVGTGNDAVMVGVHKCTDAESVTNPDFANGGHPDEGLSFLTCTVPAGTGKNDVGAGTITGYVVTMTFQTKASTDDPSFTGFRYSAPAIDNDGTAKVYVGSDSPANREVGPGDTIVIEGANFGDDVSKITVAAGASLCTETAIVTPHTKISCKLPSTANAVGSNVQIQVTVDGLASPNTPLQIAKPVITAVTTDAGGVVPPTGGTVKIAGSNFGPACATGACTTVQAIQFGANAVLCTNPEVRDTNSDGDGDEIVCQLPAADTVGANAYAACVEGGSCADLDGDGDGMSVVVEVGPTGAAQASDPFTGFKFAQPTVTQVEAGGGIRSNGTSSGTGNPSAVRGGLVTVTGTNFGLSTKGPRITITHAAGPVDFTVPEADITSVNNTQIVFKAPAGYGIDCTLAVKVFGWTPDYEGVSGSGNTAVKPPFQFGKPTIAASQESDTFTSGGTVTITGNGFGPPVAPTAQVDTVTIGGVWALGDSATVTVAGTDVAYTVIADDLTGVDDAAKRTAIVNKVVNAINTDATVSPVVLAVNGASNGELTVTTKVAGATTVVTVAKSGAGNTISIATVAATSPGHSGGIKAILSKTRKDSGGGPDVVDIRECKFPSVRVDPANAAQDQILCEMSQGGAGGQWNVYVGVSNPAGGACAVAIDEAAQTFTFSGDDCQVNGYTTVSGGNFTAIADNTDGVGVWSFKAPAPANVYYCNVADLACKNQSYAGAAFPATVTAGREIGAAQVDTVTLTGVWEVGDIATVTVNGTAVTYTVLAEDISLGDEGATRTAIAAKLSGVLNSNPTVAAAATSAGGTELVTMTGPNVGTPFTTVVSATNGAGNVDATQAIAKATATGTLGNARKLYIVGTNFGSSTETIYPGPNVKTVTNTARVWLQGSGDGTCTKNSGAETLPGVECQNAVIVEDGTKIECEVPPNVGVNIDVLVEVSGQRNAPITGNSGQTQVSYQPPEITGVTSSNTSGTEITITGVRFDGFIPDDTVDDTACYAGFFGPTAVQIQFVNPGAGISYCASPPCLAYCSSATPFKDLADGNQIKVKCTAPAGTGRNHKVQITARGVPSLANGAQQPFDGFRYDAPTVTSISTPSVLGDTITVTGTNFGAGVNQAGQGVQPVVEITHRDGTVLLPAQGWCQTISVQTAHTTLTCSVPSGVGYAYDVKVTVDSQDSATTGDAKLRYATPAISTTTTLDTVESVNYSVKPRVGNIFGETTITIAGKNFGKPEFADKVEVYFSKDDVTPANGALKDATQSFQAVESPVLSPQAGEEYLLIVKVPVGAGKNVGVYVRVDGQWSVYSARAVYDFPPPTVSSATVPSAAGGADLSGGGGQHILTITGNNFGPANTPVESVTVGAYNCLSPTVVSNTKLTCAMPKGNGTGHIVTVTIFGASSAAGEFRARFRCPEVVSISTTDALASPPAPACTGESCTAGRTGQKIVVKAKELGPTTDINFVRVKFLQPGSSDVELRYWSSSGALDDTTQVRFADGVDQPDILGVYTLVAEVPTGYGSGVAVVVEVRGQDSLGMCSALPAKLASATDQSLKFSYPKPEVLSVDAVPTIGGKITIQGKNFGGAGSTDISIVQTSYKGVEIPCTGAAVLEGFDNVRLTCTMGAGVGVRNSLFVRRGPTNSPFGNQEVSSDAFRELNYEIPVVDTGGITCYPVLADGKPDKTQPSPSCAAGDWVYLRGRNFGDNPSEMVLSIFDQTVVDPTTNEPADLASGAPPDNCRAASGDDCTHQTVMFVMPALSGKKRSIQVRVLAKNPQYATNLARSAFNAAPVFFSYKLPSISAAAPVGTEGGTVTIRGAHFGVLNAAVDATIGTKPCTGARVTEVDKTTGDGIAVECALDSGTGGNLLTTVVVHKGTSAEQSGAAPVFSYSGPRVTNIDAPGEPKLPDGSVNRNGSGKTGDLLVVEGSSFGINADSIKVQFVDSQNQVVGTCGGLQLVTDHTKVTCVAPQAEGLNLSVQVDIGGQLSPLADAPQFTFIVKGCKNPTARNYNPNATDEDNSCVVVGCTDSNAENYTATPANGRVEDTNPSQCRMPPIVAEVRRDLDYDTYLADKARYDSLHLDNMASNMGVDRSRLSIVSTRRGSVIFVTRVVDVAPASREPGEPSVAAAVTTLDSKIRSGSFAEVNEMPLLGIKYNTSSGTALPPSVVTGSEVSTPAGDTRISVWNYVAFGIAGVAVLTLAVFSKAIVRRCCHRRERGGDPLPKGNRVAPLDLEGARSLGPAKASGRGSDGSSQANKVDVTPPQSLPGALFSRDAKYGGTVDAPRPGSRAHRMAARTGHGIVAGAGGGYNAFDPGRAGAAPGRNDRNVYARGPLLL